MASLFDEKHVPSGRAPAGAQTMTGASDTASPEAAAPQLCPEKRTAPETQDHEKPVVYFDGSCPLCLAEIGHYRRKDRSGDLDFVDVSKPGAPTPAGVSSEQAMKRFHVRAADGRVLSGAAAFVEIWDRLPGWRWAARAAALPGALTALELGYRMFLPVRPFLSRLFGRFAAHRPRADKTVR